MRKSVHSCAALPPVAFATHSTTGATIMIRRGERCYYRIATRLKADELNRVFGVTPAQATAMLTGSMFGWDSSLADPATYAETPRGVSTNARRVHKQ